MKLASTGNFKQTQTQARRNALRKALNGNVQDTAPPRQAAMMAGWDWDV